MGLDYVFTWHGIITSLQMVSIAKFFVLTDEEERLKKDREDWAIPVASRFKDLLVIPVPKATDT